MQKRTSNVSSQTAKALAVIDLFGVLALKANSDIIFGSKKHKSEREKEHDIDSTGMISVLKSEMTWEKDREVAELESKLAKDHDVKSTTTINNLKAEMAQVGDRKITELELELEEKYDLGKSQRSPELRPRAKN